jgi:hypothetical protein
MKQQCIRGKELLVSPTHMQSCNSAEPQRTTMASQSALRSQPCADRIRPLACNKSRSTAACKQLLLRCRMHTSTAPALRAAQRAAAAAADTLLSWQPLQPCALPRAVLLPRAFARCAHCMLLLSLLGMLPCSYSQLLRSQRVRQRHRRVTVVHGGKGFGSSIEQQQSASARGRGGCDTLWRR